MTIDSMFRMLCLGLIGREKFMGAVLFAKSCGLITPAESDFLHWASWIALTGMGLCVRLSASFTRAEPGRI